MARVNTFGHAVKGLLGRYSRHKGSLSITLGTLSTGIASIAAGTQQFQERLYGVSCRVKSSQSLISALATFPPLYHAVQRP